MIATGLFNIVSCALIFICSVAATPVGGISVNTPRSNNGVGKVGIAWPNGNDTTFGNFKNANVGPIYTWSPLIPTAAKSLGFEPIPMLWGENQVSDFQRLVVKGYATTVLGFNEPEQASQSNISPARAAQLWRQYIDPLKDQGYSLISPACSAATSSGKSWMQSFFAACSGCHFDGVALHYYGTSSQDFINHVTDFHLTFGLPVWPTEFGCQNLNGGAQCTTSDASNFMTAVKNFMDGTSWIPHYFSFGMIKSTTPYVNQLIDANGQPTALGLLYIS